MDNFNRLLTATKAFMFLCCGLMWVAIAYLSYRAVPVVEQIGETVESAPALIEQQGKETRETVKEAVGEIVAGTLKLETNLSGHTTEALGQVLDHLDNLEPAVLGVVDKRVGEVTGPAKDLVLAYSGIPSKFEDLFEYMDCEHNDLCWPDQFNAYLFNGNMMVRNANLMFDDARQKLFPQIMDTSVTLARTGDVLGKTAEVEIPRLAWHFANITESVDKWLKPSPLKRALGYGVQAGTAYATWHSALGSQKVEIVKGK